MQTAIRLGPVAPHTFSSTFLSAGALMFSVSIKQGKAVLLQACSGPQGSQVVKRSQIS